MAIKNKFSNIQCTYPQKKGDLCGVHARSKNVIKIDHMDQLNPTIEEGILDSPLTKKIKVIGSDDECLQNQKITKDLILNIHSPDYLKVYDLRKFIKTNKLKISTKHSKREIFNTLKKYFETENYYLLNLDAVHFIQRSWRRRDYWRRYKCTNSTDLLTLESKYEIPIQNYYEIQDESTGLFYCFDIRSIIEIVENEQSPKNPYTSRNLSPSTLADIKSHTEKLIADGCEISLNKQTLTEEQEITFYMIDIFQKFNELDNYTDHTWFKKLSSDKLKTLYQKAEDIWNYRSEMDITKKKLIVSDGIAFTVPMNYVNYCNDVQKLQRLILDEFYRFATEGSTRDDKKLGVMLMLTALVEVSPEAANAMPLYLQIT